MESTSIILYPSPGMGHLISMVELGKFISHHHPHVKVTILVSLPSINTGTTAAYVSRVSATVPSITFHHLPIVSLPRDLEAYPSMEAVIFEIIKLSNTHVQRALESISAVTSIAAFIIDLFCTPAFHIAADFKIPTYYFFTSGAACLAFFLYFPTLHQTVSESFKDLHMLLDIPGIPPLPSSDMIMPLLDRNSTDYSDFLEFSINLPKSAGIVINTFKSLEPRALKAISAGICVPDSTPPRLFCVGPLIAAGNAKGDGHDCLNWLDSQPRQSVVYLCFGSLGLLSAKQTKEIALGLERSGQRFLWVVRRPPSEDKSKRFLPPPEPELEFLLPDGFLERTKDRGFVVKSWAPQTAVLNHDSVGGFVTHCGWNSVLEAVSAGVAMVAWPLYAEQRLNKVILVEEMKMALPVDEGEGGLVTAEEVERRVRELMESEEGRKMKEVLKAKKEEACMALSGGGSSLAALAELVNSWNLH